MAPWVQITLAAFSVVRELIRYFDKKSSCKKETAKKMIEFKKAVKEGKTHEIKKHFIDVGLIDSDG